MKRKYWSLLFIPLLLASCSGENIEKKGEYQASIENAGFETGDLSGWIMSGNIYNNECLSENLEISGEKTLHDNRYHLAGYYQEPSATGFLQSSAFKVSNTNHISFLIAGGKNKDLCYVGLYSNANNTLLEKVSNTYFVESSIKTSSRENSYARIVWDLSKYAGQEVYLRIVDEDTSNDFGYISVDAFDVDVSFSNLSLYKRDAINRQVEPGEVIEDSEFQVSNGGFERGFEGWTVVEGEAFNETQIINDTKWVLFNDPKYTVPYHNDGKFYAGWEDEAKTGVLRSSTFEMSGNGYMTFKLGGGRSGALCYVSLYEKLDSGESIEVARFYNQKFHEYGGWLGSQSDNPLYICNMVKYKYNAKHLIGKNLYFEIHDYGTNLFNMFFLDSFITYYEDNEKNEEKLKSAVEAVSILPVKEEANINTIVNSGFETGDLTGWQNISGDAFKKLYTQNAWWVEAIPFNKSGNYYLGDVEQEELVGVLRSSNFVLGGSGFVSMKLGGAGNPNKCYISIKKAENGEEIARISTKYSDVGFPNTNEIRMYNMSTYGYNLEEYLGETLYLEIVDNASSSADGFFRTIVADEFDMYHESIPHADTYVLAENLL